MSSVPTINPDPPPPPPPPPPSPPRASSPPVRRVLGVPLTSDAGLVLRKASTWLALSSASASAGLAAYAIMPARVQELVPDWTLAMNAGVAIVSAMLIPLATSIRQKAP